MKKFKRVSKILGVGAGVYMLAAISIYGVHESIRARSNSNDQAKHAESIVKEGVTKPEPQNQPVEEPVSTSTQSRVRGTTDNFKCNKTVIPRGATVYLDRDYMEIGQTQASPGYDGYVYDCPSVPSLHNVKSEPVADIVYRGTKKPVDQAALRAEQERQALLQRERAEAERNQKIQACIKSIRAQLSAAGAGGSSEWYYAPTRCAQMY